MLARHFAPRLLALLALLALALAPGCSGGDDPGDADDTAGSGDTADTGGGTDTGDTGTTGDTTGDSSSDDAPDGDAQSDSSAADASDTGTRPDQTDPPELTDASDAADASDGSPTGSPLSDDFDGPPTDLLAETYGDWRVLHPERALVLDVGLTDAGWLTVVPVELAQNAWFEDQYGPLVYREVTGNFAAMTRLRVVDKDDRSAPPSHGFNAGGFVVRDPAGTHTGDENWVMLNIGGQGGPGVAFGREIKKTLASNSDLYVNPVDPLDPAGLEAGLASHLLVCRVGARFHFYHWRGGVWVEERYHNAAEVDGAQVTTFAPAGTEITPELTLPPPGGSVPLVFEHAAMPQTVQVGVMGHTWAGEHDTHASFDRVRFAEPAPDTAADCVAAFADPTAP